MRDDFPRDVKVVVAERAAYICSNPSCRAPTVEPHSDPEKSLKTGEAAHICAASVGGPRYDGNQSPEERRHISNSIWLCTKCSTMIDKDENAYPPALLRQWKAEHEAWLRNGGIVPALPEISFMTLAGFTLPDNPATIKLSEITDLREHRLTFRNLSDADILQLDVRLQAPEPVICMGIREQPPGIDVRFEAHRPEMMVMGSGTVTRNRPPLPPQEFKIAFDRMPTKKPIEFVLYTSIKHLAQHDLSEESGVFAELHKPPYLRHFIAGTFQFLYRGATLTRKIFSPIAFDKERRAITILEVREDFGEWKPVDVGIFS